MSDSRAEIPGSARIQTAAAIRPAVSDRPVTVTILLRRSPSAPDLTEDLLSGRFQAAGRENAAAIMGADPKDVTAVKGFLARWGLKIVDENLAARTLRAQGTVHEIDAAFGVRLMVFGAPDGTEFLSHEGAISVPADLSGIIVAVLGLDQRRIAEPRGVVV